MAIKLGAVGTLSYRGPMRRAGRDIALQWHNPASGEAPRAVGVNALTRHRGEWQHLPQAEGEAMITATGRAFG